MSGALPDARAHLWDISNEGYRALVVESRSRLQALVEELLPPGARLLDVGCGDGDLAVLLRDWQPDAEYVGIDVLPERIRRARDRLPDVEFHVGTAAALPFPDASFDAAAALTVFSSLPSFDAESSVAGEIGRVLRPGGVLVWYDIRYPSPANPHVRPLGEGRIHALFPGWQVRLDSISLLPPLARRLGRTSRVAYPLLASVPLLRSHLIGSLSRP